ncbi:MAG TPA: branched-chain amino acid ABC transporter substrate-binding protein [Kiloniellales bacterium]|nr:branched-chain amino acid ABC transporter substrate-binding protein [Kiloniellales bacterium]
MRKVAFALAALVASLSVAKADILIGTAGPMTGDYAAFGMQLQRGAEAAVADINAAGGVNGQQLKLVVGDDVCDPKQATAVANQMVSQGVVFVAGHFCSGSTMPASDVYGEERILMITPSSTNPAVTEGPAAKGIDTIFRTCGRDDQQGSFAGRWVAENYKNGKIAILHDKSTGGKGYADIVKATMNSMGVQETLYEAYTAGEQDYTALVSKLKAAQIDVIVLGGYHTEGALIIKQAHEQGYKPQMIGPDSLNTQELWTIAGEAAEGVMFSNAADPRNFPTAQAVAEKLRAQGYEPEGYTLTNYAAVQVWAMAANEAGTTEAEAVAAKLREHPWDTIIGTLEFDEKGDLKTAAYVWYQFKDGSYQQM